MNTFFAKFQLDVGWSKLCVFNRRGQQIAGWCGDTVKRLSPYDLHQGKKYEFEFVVKRRGRGDIRLRRDSDDDVVVSILGVPSLGGDYIFEDVIAQICPAFGKSPVWVDVHLWEIEEYPWEDVKSG
jgi:hypothetical protein